jgi:hypothetical protein
MIGRRQSQQSGSNSLNIQGRDIAIGLSYADVRQVAMDVFEANFLRLRDVAAVVARERAEAFLDSYLQKMAEEGQAEIPEAENPDLQYAVFSAQKEYARTGDEDLGKLLVQLLADRTKVRDRNLTQIVLNESLSVAPKLPPDQLDALSLTFLLMMNSTSWVRGLEPTPKRCHRGAVDRELASVRHLPGRCLSRRSRCNNAASC